MNCLSLNIQGAGSGDKRVRVQGLCNRNRISFLGIQETKMTDMDLVTVRSLWGNVSFDYAVSNARGLSGSILAIWDQIFSVGEGCVLIFISWLWRFPKIFMSLLLPYMRLRILGLREGYGNL